MRSRAAALGTIHKKAASTSTPTSATAPPTSNTRASRYRPVRTLSDAVAVFVEGIPDNVAENPLCFKAMSLRGVLSTMPAEDVLEWVAKKKLAAPITFERRGVVRSVVVEDGHIVWASSNRRDEKLGVILVASGLVAERALADALEARAETGVPLGKVLLMSGLITELDLIEILATKIRETVTDVLTWTDGQFDVVPRTQPPATGVNAQLADRYLPRPSRAGIRRG